MTSTTIYVPCHGQYDLTFLFSPVHVNSVFAPINDAFAAVDPPTLNKVRHILFCAPSINWYLVLSDHTRL